MTKLYRILSSLVVGLGLILLFVYCGFSKAADSQTLLNQPSYYILQNYWYLLLSGCGCIAFSIVSCFLSWHKDMDPKVEILPNAVGAESQEVLNWLSGSSLDTRDAEQKIPAAGTQKPTMSSTLDAADTVCEATAVQQEEATVVEEATVAEEATILEDEESTVLTEGVTDASEPATEQETEATIIDWDGRRM